MKINQPLTPEQQSMVEQNTALIHWTIQKYIDVNEAICGLGYEDLFQEGALALCYAATTYRTGGTQFQTYAVTVIRNHLLDYCQRIVTLCRNMPICSLDTSHGEDRPPPVKESKIARDDTEKWVARIYLSQLLEHGKRHYKGVAKLGIEAMELKIKRCGHCPPISHKAYPCGCLDFPSVRKTAAGCHEWRVGVFRES